MSPDQTQPGLTISDGAILLYRLFDVGDEIDLAAATTHLSSLAPARRLRFSRVAPRHIQISDPPVAVTLEPMSIPVLGEPTSAEVSARIYDYGALSITFSVNTANWTWDRLQQAANGFATDAQAEALIDEAARRVAELLLSNLGETVIDPHGLNWTEDYVVYFISAFSERLSADELLRRVDPSHLLLGEAPSSKLSSFEREQATRLRFSYYQDDLTIIDWNAALVYEPSGERDVPDILEYATSQLLELRYYDDLLDRELDRIYEQVAIGTRAWNPYLPNRHLRLARHLTLLLVEITEITERIENSLKVINDLYLAKIYHASVERFRIQHWQRSVHRKLDRVQSVHQVVQNRIATSRSLMLEAIIVLLIVTEILLALLRVKH